ncbi:MAG: RIP metalloprotease RseP [Candidatus Omnitrophica bacterium]|nr:RIP metalloprotease RseP [Candidatus Omnitrophota bacterium]
MLSTITFLVILGILIVAHEFGHFIAAKLNGVGVERFAIGFGPCLFRKKAGETEFVICAFPLGGYVKLAGDNRPACKGLTNEFYSKPVGIRMRIVFAGPLFNYLLAFILFWTIALIGFPYPEPIVGKVKEGYPAAAAGVKEADRVLEVNGIKVDTWIDMTQLIRASKDKVELTLERDGKIISLPVSLEQTSLGDEMGRKRNVPVIGIEASSKMRIVKYNIVTGFVQGGKYLFEHTYITVLGFGYMILGKIPAKEAMVGPLGIWQFTSEAVRVGIVAVLLLMASLSVSLAIVNLFPLPVLDGGHLFLSMWEKIRRKPLSERVEDVLTKAGIGVIGLLFLFVFYNDIIKFGPRHRMWSGQKEQNAVVQNLSETDENKQ